MHTRFSVDLFLFLLDMYPAVELASLMVTLQLPFFFLRNGQTIWLSGYTNLCSHQQCPSFPISPLSWQHLLLTDFLLLAILMGVNRDLIVVLIYVFLAAFNIEHLFMGLLAACLSSLEKCRVRFFAHFPIGLSVFYRVVTVLYLFWV